jgi:hypothetical protein
MKQSCLKAYCSEMLNKDGNGVEEEQEIEESLETN